MSEHEPAPIRLDVDGLTVELQRHGSFVPVNRATFSVHADRVLAIIGESGSGKSLLLRALAGAITPRARLAGTVALNGDTVAVARQRDRFWRNFSLIFQNPMTSLDPAYRVGTQIIETVRYHTPMSRAEAREHAEALLAAVRIHDPASVLRLYPHECSGGMRQRIVIAIALATQPKFLLADEPTTALDVGVQAHLLRLLRDLHKSRSMGIILVTHDISVASVIADDVAVMYAGSLVEIGPREEVLERPRHPYTRGLLAANIRRGMTGRPMSIPGQPPHLVGLPDICAFAPRCLHVQADCWTSAPGPQSVSPVHQIRCHHYLTLTG